jgi:hypothetical protein
LSLPATDDIAAATGDKGGDARDDYRRRLGGVTTALREAVSDINVYPVAFTGKSAPLAPVEIQQDAIEVNTAWLARRSSLAPSLILAGAPS